MDPDEVLYSYEASSWRTRYWHRVVEGRTRCSGVSIEKRQARKKDVVAKRFGDMSDREKNFMCRKCLGANECKLHTERKRAKAEGRIAPFHSPKCPACLARPVPEDVLMEWWQERRRWRCPACRTLYTADMEEIR